MHLKKNHSNACMYLVFISVCKKIANSSAHIKICLSDYLYHSTSTKHVKKAAWSARQYGRPIYIYRYKNNIIHCSFVADNTAAKKKHCTKSRIFPHKLAELQI